MNVDASLDAIQTALATLESDAPLRDRVDAMQDLASLLRTVPILDGIDDAIGAGLRSQIYGRSVPSLLVSLMNECGEDHDASRNPILESLSRLVFFLSAEELLEDARLWALLTRMLQSGDDESVGYAVAAVRRFILDEVCTPLLLGTRRLQHRMDRLALSLNPATAAEAAEVGDHLRRAAENAAQAEEQGHAAKVEEEMRQAATRSRASSDPSGAAARRGSRTGGFGLSRVWRSSRDINLSNTMSTCSSSSVHEELSAESSPSGVASPEPQQQQQRRRGRWSRGSRSSSQEAMAAEAEAAMAAAEEEEALRENTQPPPIEPPPDSFEEDLRSTHFETSPTTQRAANQPQLFSLAKPVATQRRLGQNRFVPSDRDVVTRESRPPSMAPAAEPQDEEAATVPPPPPPPLPPAVVVAKEEDTAASLTSPRSRAVDARRARRLARMATAPSAALVVPPIEEPPPSTLYDAQRAAEEDADDDDDEDLELSFERASHSSKEPEEEEEVERGAVSLGDADFAVLEAEMAAARLEERAPPRQAAGVVATEEVLMSAEEKRRQRRQRYNQQPPPVAQAGARPRLGTY